jgi:hypothetical protein
MKSVMHGGLALVLVLGIAGIAMAQVVPWKVGDPPRADAPAAPGAAVAAPAGDAAGTAAPVDAKTEKASAPVKKILTQIETVQKQCDEEAAKPTDKQDPKKVRSMKEAIARLYLTAAQTAKTQSATFKGDEKQAFLDQFDKPNREKSISLLLELANDSLTKKDYRNAASIAKQVLALDPKNAEAEALLKKIAEEMAAAAKTGSKTTGNVGSGDSKNPLDPNLRDFSRDGRGVKSDYGKSDGKGGTRQY